MKKYLIIILLVLAATVNGGSFNIDSSASLIEFTQIYAFSDQNNYGSSAALLFGDGYVPQSRYSWVILRFSSLDDTISALGSVTLDSAVVGLPVQGEALDAADPTIPDSLIVTLHRMTEACWQEGVSDGAAGGGATWDSASAVGSGSYPDPCDWTSNGGDYSATVETLSGWGDKGDSLVWTDANVDAGDTLYLPVSSATLTSLSSSNTGLLLKARIVDGDAASQSIYINFYGTNDGTANQWPFITVYYTEQSVTATKSLKKVKLGNVKL